MVTPREDSSRSSNRRAGIGASAKVFSVGARDRLRDDLLALARTDVRVVAAAAVGGSADSNGDRWSDLDLSFAVAADATVEAVLADWTANLERVHGAARLFDLPVHTTIYRVYLLPGNLQVDLSFSPESDFGASGPRFTLLFGRAVEKAPPPDASPSDLFGLGAHHAVRARFCIERERPWQAEYWISGIRNEALALACLRHGVETKHGRGADRLPAETLSRARLALVGSPERSELLRAFQAALDFLLHEATGVPSATPYLAAQLTTLTAHHLT